MHLPGLSDTMQALMSDRMKHGEDLASMMANAGARTAERTRHIHPP